MVALGQTYSPESLAFFVRLYYEIGKVGAISIVETLSGKLHIVWRTESWKDILSGVSKYFSDIYGEKFIGFQKLSKIYELKSNLTDDSSKVTLVKLVYSLVESGKSRKISLNEKLQALGLTDDSNVESETLFLDNPKIPSFSYLLGFLLGDGSILVRIRLSSSGSFWFIPLLVFPQKPSEYNRHMYTMMSKFFENLGIKPYVTTRNGESATLYVEGLKAVAPLVPLFKEYQSLGYWKSENINLLIEFLKYHSAGVQTF